MINKEDLEKKYKDLSNLKKEIKSMEFEYAKENSIFKEGDNVISNKIKDTIFEVSNKFYYYNAGDYIYLDCKVLSTSNKLININNIYCNSEKDLKLI